MTKVCTTHIEKITSGFMGYPLIYNVWIDNKLIMYSVDNQKTWRFIKDKKLSVGPNDFKTVIAA